MRHATRTLLAAVGGVGIVAGSAVGVGEAAAAPTSSCSFTFLNPNLNVVRGYANAFVADSGPTHARVSVIANPQTVLGYTQQMTVTWANLDTGKSGSAATQPTRVVGQDATLTTGPIATGKGRVHVVVGLSNTSSLNPRSSTNGDCSLEHRVGARSR